MPFNIFQLCDINAIYQNRKDNLNIHALHHHHKNTLIFVILSIVQSVVLSLSLKEIKLYPWFMFPYFIESALQSNVIKITS